MRNRGLVLISFIAGILFCVQVPHIAAQNASIYDPNPLINDLVLPMPMGQQIVFREIVVPGENFWADEERIVEIGYSSGMPDAIFEGNQRVLVSGSFKKRNKWVNYLGKYELNVGQFLAMLGVQRFLELSSQYYTEEQAQASVSERLQEINSRYSGAKQKTKKIELAKKPDVSKKRGS